MTTVTKSTSDLSPGDTLTNGWTVLATNAKTFNMATGTFGVDITWTKPGFSTKTVWAPYKDVEVVA